MKFSRTGTNSPFPRSLSVEFRVRRNCGMWGIGLIGDRARMIGVIVGPVVFSVEIRWY